MHRRHFIAGAVALIATTRAASAETLVVNSPSDGYLNLRTGPGSQYEILRRMTHGSTVKVLERGPGGWVRVRHQSGAQGWCFAQYLARPASKWWRVNSPRDGYLNLRTGPGTQYSIVRRMLNGEQVKLLERQGGWARVRHQSGAEGWCAMRYLVD